MPITRGLVISVSSAVLLLALGIVLPVTLALSPETLTLLWVLIGILLVVVAVLATPLRGFTARFLAADPEAPDDRTVHIATLVTPDDPVVRGRVFEGKVIVGPVVLMGGSNGLHFENCHFNWSTGTLYWEIDGARPPQGAIRVEACAFRNCEFINVGFALTKADIESSRATFPGS